MASVLSNSFLSLLRCPHSLAPLQWATPEQVSHFNRSVFSDKAISSKELFITEPISQALFCEKSALIYPVHQDIPILLPNHAVSITT